MNQGNSQEFKRDIYLNVLPNKLLFPKGRRPRVLFLGNGINRAYGFASWEDFFQLLRDPQYPVDVDTDVPFLHRPYIVTQGRVKTALKRAAPKLCKLGPPQEEQRLIRDYLQLPWDAVFTTNYTYEIEKSWMPNFSVQASRPVEERKRINGVSVAKSHIQSTRTWFDLPGLPYPIWHIHGEAGLPDTMVLDGQYYTRHIVHIWSEIQRSDRVIPGLRSGQKDIYGYSWVDYFLYGDIYMVGFGMSESEINIWDLLHHKRIRDPGSQVAFFTPISPSRGMRQMLEVRHIKICEETNFQGDWASYYHQVVQEIKTDIITN